MKSHNIKILVNDSVIFEENRKGGNKSKKNQYIRGAAETADLYLLEGESCVIHYQQQGAKGWAVLEYTSGSENVHQVGTFRDK